MSNNINIDVKVFEQRTTLDNYLGFNSPTNQPANSGTSAATSSMPASDLDSVFALWSQPTNSNTNGAFASINTLFADPSQMPKVENYGGFQFKNTKEQSAVDQTLAALRQAQAANPGQKMSKTVKVGKYKLTVTVNEDGSVHIKRKKKRGGLFGGIGNFFKKVGGLLKKALPIISMVAMFVPGLQPLALAARIASGVMGVVDGIKNGNIFGALTSAVGAFSGVGGKVGNFFSNIGSKASGLFNSLGGQATNWFSSAFNSASNLVTKAKDIWSGFTSNIGSSVSNFLFKNGSSFVGDLAKSFGGNVGNWLTQNGSNIVRSFSDMVGNRAIGWMNEKANNVLSRLMDNPVAQKVGGFLNSGFGQMLMELIRGKQA